MPMRMSNPDLPLLPLLLPMFIVGLAPLALLPLVGFLGLVVVGLLIGSGAVMAQMEEQAAHARQVITHGFAPHAERAGYSVKLRSMLDFLFLAKIVGAGLIVAGFAGFYLR